MALARAARSGFFRSRGAIPCYSCGKDMLFDMGPTQKLLSSLESITSGGANLSRFSGTRKVDIASFGSRGIRTTPQHQSPFAERVIEESDSEHDSPNYPGLEATRPGEKPRVVVLGTGWAACRFLKGLDTKIYDVVCISPRNHMVFTPLLASTCVGTLEFRSVTEPVGRIQPALATEPNSYFYLASCTGIDTNRHEVSEPLYCICTYLINATSKKHVLC